MTASASVDNGADVIGELHALLGAGHVLTDSEARLFYSQDVFAQGIACAAVVRPASVSELAAVVGRATAAGYDVIARGGGMSYTGGYLPTRERSIILDLARLDRIVEINQTDMYVTVEAGCTWATLRSALQPLGLRTPYWGPLSGLKSTVGGAVSQNSVFFGSGLHGTAADSVIGLKVVLADGTTVTTGSAGGAGANAFFRHYGPDLTGLFTGDAGALGIKAEVTLRLIHRPAERRHASFAFESRDQLVEAMLCIARAGLASECFAFDPFLQSVRMRRASLMSDVKMFAAVVASQGSALRGLGEGLRMAIAGRRFARDVEWPLHVSTEGRCDASADSALAAIRALALAAGGRETENTVPKAVDAAPFGPMNGMVGVDGERWVPVHGVVPNSRVRAFLADLDRLVAGHAAEMDSKGVTTGYLLTSVGPGATLIEPVFYWPDALMPIHEASVEPGFLARLPRHEAAPDTRAFVLGLRQAAIDLFVRHGAIHFQVGKTYPLAQTRDAAGRSLLEAVKRALDPGGSVNPGALGMGRT